jgi:hypothetical protein
MEKSYKIMIEKNEKYALTDQYIEYCGEILYRIIALSDFGSVKKGDLGGWCSKNSNIDSGGSAWVYNNAKMLGSSEIWCDAILKENAEMHNDSIANQNSIMTGNSKSYHDSVLYDEAHMSGNSILLGGETLERSGDLKHSETYSWGLIKIEHVKYFRSIQVSDNHISGIWFFMSIDDWKTCETIDDFKKGQEFGPNNEEFFLDVIETDTLENLLIIKKSILLLISLRKNNDHFWNEIEKNYPAYTLINSELRQCCDGRVKNL